MLVLNAHNHCSFEKAIAELGKVNNDDIQVCIDETLEQIVLSNKKSNENLIDSLANEDVNVEQELDDILKFLDNENDSNAKSYVEPNKNNECRTPSNLLSEEEIRNYLLNSPKKPNVLQKQSVLSESLAQKSSIDNECRTPSNVSSEEEIRSYLLNSPKKPNVFQEQIALSESLAQKSSIDAFERSNHFMNPRVLLKRLSIFTERKLKNKWFSCSYNKCHFTTKNWKLMYNHVKFTHLQPYKLKRERFKRRFKCKDANRSNKLEMKALVILKRLPTYIANSERSIPVKLWFPYSRGSTLKDLSTNHNRKVISTQKYTCAFDNCMYFCNNWKAMHRHVKLYHVRPLKSFNIYFSNSNQKDRLDDHTEV